MGLQRPLGRWVDTVDDWLDDHVHGPCDGYAPPRRVERSDLADHRRAREALRRATAGVLFLRNKLEAEQIERRVRMARVCHALVRAVREEDDEITLSLMTYRDQLRERLREAEEELAGLRTQAADAKASLARLARAIARLEHGRGRGRRAPRRIPPR